MHASSAEVLPVEVHDSGIPHSSSDQPDASLQANDVLEPIAIIGASCRLPGSSTDLQKFWELLKARKSAWSPFPDSRFSHKGFHNSSDRRKHGTTNTGGGHFLDYDVAAFDSSFFSMHPNEVKAMDPQQRLLLEIAYEAFENAGFTLDDLSNSSTGVYVGQWTSDYHDIITRDRDYNPNYLAVGTGPAISSNRISYFFDLKGPSFTLDTGCSASLVALHQAVQGLRAGDAEQSIVAGVNLTLDPHRYAYISQVNMFSKEGKSFPFDSRASGYGRGEGCSAVLLQPLSLALKQGRPIRAIIRNSACNQDGRTSGITVPSSSAQLAAIKKAYEDASLELYADYVEAHGTGTRVGDPIEAKAISSALGVNRSPDLPLPIGSVKGNIGHLESAAGVTSLVKAVLMLENNEIPPQMNHEICNPTIKLNKLNLRIPLELERGGLNRISVNCFGYGGTNAHVIVDAARTIMPSINGTVKLKNGIDDKKLDVERANGNTINGANGFATNGSEAETLKHDETTNGISKGDKQRLFIVSAATELSCQTMATNLADYLHKKASGTDKEDDVLNKVAYTLSRRTLFAHRIGLISPTMANLADQLREIAKQPILAHEGKTLQHIAFVFSGQGAQYPRMGRELLGKWPIFTTSMDRAGKCVIQCGSAWNLVEELLKPEETSHVADPELAQPLTTAIQLALVDVLRDLGVHPTAVVGHSSGEIAAAYCTGMLTFEDAIAVSFHRGRLASVLVKQSSGSAGTMLAVGAAPAAVQELISSLGDARSRLQIACYNSPSSVTVSGDTEAVEMLQPIMDEHNIFNRKLRTSGVAYHSHQMKLIGEEYGAAIADIKPTTGNPSISMISSLTGEPIGDRVVDADYWVQNMLSPVRFAEAVTKVAEKKSRGKKIDMFLEIGPHFQLVGPVKQTLKSLGPAASKIQVTGCLKRGEDAETCLLETLKTLWLEKYPVNLERVNSGFTKPPALLVDLPPYSFDHSKTFWHEGRASKLYRSREQLPHELLGTMSFESNPIEPCWRLCLRLEDLSWLKGHQVEGEIIFPATAFIGMAIQAAEQHAHYQNSEAVIKEFQLKNICIEKALVLNNAKDDLELFVNFRPQTISAKSSSNLWNEFRIFSTSANNRWSQHARGLIRAALNGETNSDVPANSVAFNQVGRNVNPKKFYFLSKDFGLDWNAPFDSLTDIKLCGGAAVSTVTTSKIDDVGYGPDGPLYVIHPATLDSCLFQGMAAVILLEDKLTTPFAPTFIKNLRIAARSGNGKLAKDITCVTKRSGGEFLFDISGFEKDCEENMIIEAQGVRVTPLPNLAANAKSDREFCHYVDWVAYMPITSEAWLQDTCRSLVKRETAANQSHALEALSLSYMKSAIESITREQVPDNHLRYWYDAIQKDVSQKYDEEDLHVGLTDDSVFGRIINRMGPRLADILQGSVDAVTLLTEDNDFAGLYDNEAWNRCYVQILRLCKELGLHNPDQKILEIGTGGASISQPLLASLSAFDKTLASTYHYLDVDSSFLQDKLSDSNEAASYRKLDIASHIVSQGFESDEYDLIIAVNAVHATTSIDKSLDSIRTLLKPGGRLILMETTKDTIPLNLVLGALPGWWAGHEEGRILSPLVTEETWSSKLENLGFTQTKPCFRDYEQEDGGSQCVFVASSESGSSVRPTPAVDVVSSSEQNAAALRFVEELKQKISGAEIALRDLKSPAVNAKVSIILDDITNRLNGIDTDQFDDFKKRITSSETVLFVTQDEMKDSQMNNCAWIAGFCRTLRLEYPDIRIVQLHVEGQSESSKIDAAVNVLQSPSMDLAVTSGQVELEFALRSGQLYVPRFVPHQEMSSYIHQSHGELETTQSEYIGDRTLVSELGTPNQIETIRWTDDLEADMPLPPDQIRLRLCAAGVNFKEVLIAGGHLEGLTKIVNDCSGVVIEVGENMKSRFQIGERVCASNTKAYTNYPAVLGDCCTQIPDEMDFDTAASIPTVWMTVYQALVECARLQTGDKILIHSAAGAVGQAAILLSQHLGAEVFATCGSDIKKEFLVTEFKIPENHIFGSRTTAFRDEIMSATSGEGVDVVLNSLGGNLLQASCHVLAPFGRFIEIGRKDMMEDTVLPTEFLLNNITFSCVDLAQVCARRPGILHRLLRNCMDLFAAGSIRHITMTKMPISEIAKAFRLLQTGKQIGKIILTVEPGQQVKTVCPRPKLPVLKADATYIIAGGLGGLGKQILSWFAERGARNVVIMSRSGAIDSEAESVIARLHSEGITVAVKRCDITSKDALQHVLSEIKGEMPPVRGVIQSAMVLRESLFVDMTATDWFEAVTPKTVGTWNLHTMLPMDMDFFISLSSAVAIAGNIGQCNYAAACSSQDGLAHYRTRLGLAAHSINLGAIAEAGYVSENPEVAVTLRRQGLGSINVSDFLSHLDLVVRKEDHRRETGQQLPCQSIIGLLPSGTELGLGQSHWMNDKKCALLNGLAQNSSNGSNNSADEGVALGSAKSHEEALAIATRAALQQLGNMIGLASSSMSPAKGLSDYGADSLIAVELRSWISMHLKANIPLLVLRGTTSITELGGLIVRESKLIGEAIRSG